MTRRSKSSTISFDQTDESKNRCKNVLKKRVPITQWLPQYQISTFLQDLLAGFTVSLTEIPQSIAYAGVGGLPAQYGLYSCIMGGFTYAIFGTCKDTNIGPTSIMSLMNQPYVIKYGPEFAVLMSFLCGVIIFLLGACNLGFVIDFFSFPIIAGFTCAAALEIASIQLSNFLGTTSTADNFITAWSQLIQNFNDISLWDSVLGLLSLIFLIVLKEVAKFGSLKPKPNWSLTRNIIGTIIFLLSLARNALVIIIGILIAYNLDDSAPFYLTGEVKEGLPEFKLPPFSTSNNGTTFTFEEIVSGVGTSLIFVPIVAILELVTIEKNFAQGQSIDATQEILTLGLTNILNSFVGAMPITGTFSRSAINNASGVKTPLGGVFTSLISLLAMSLLTPTFYYVPRATMAAVIICAMIYLFKYEAVPIMWHNKKLDLIPFLITFVACLGLSLEYGILIGIGVNVLFILYPSARPKIQEEVKKIAKTQTEVLLLTPLDNLFYPSAEYLRDHILNSPQDLLVVLNGKYLRSIDITVARSLMVLTSNMRKRGSTIVLWNFKPKIMKVCVGLDQDLEQHFSNGELEDVVQDVVLNV